MKTLAYIHASQFFFSKMNICKLKKNTLLTHVEQFLFRVSIVEFLKVYVLRKKMFFNITDIYL